LKRPFILAIQSQSINTLNRNDQDMSVSQIAFADPFYNYSYTSLYKDEKSLLKDL